jgi:hypothetical protein
VCNRHLFTNAPGNILVVPLLLIHGPPNNLYIYVHIDLSSLIIVHHAEYISVKIKNFVNILKYIYIHFFIVYVSIYSATQIFGGILASFIQFSSNTRFSINIHIYYTFQSIRFNNARRRAQEEPRAC